jgi:hypothetical protein
MGVIIIVHTASAHTVIGIAVRAISISALARQYCAWATIVDSLALFSRCPFIQFP